MLGQLANGWDRNYIHIANLIFSFVRAQVFELEFLLTDCLEVDHYAETVKNDWMSISNEQDSLSWKTPLRVGLSGRSYFLPMIFTTWNQLELFIAGRLRHVKGLRNLNIKPDCLYVPHIGRAPWSSRVFGAVNGAFVPRGARLFYIPCFSTGRGEFIGPTGELVSKW